MSEMIEFAGHAGPAYLRPHAIDGIATAYDGPDGRPRAIILTRGGQTVTVSGQAPEVARHVAAARDAEIAALTASPSIVDATATAPAEPAPPEPPLSVRGMLADAETSLAEAIARFGQVGASFRITGERAGACGLPGARRAQAVSYADVQVRRATQAILAAAAEQL